MRFSSAKQSSGTSIERQTVYAAKWAEEHGLALDAALSMLDEGLSGYHQAHVKKGALGVFLRAVEDGKVAPGSVLIVEQLDRLSRAEPILAQGQLSQIIGADIRVVTASDGREYSRETLKKDPMGLVFSLLTMIRAHEESDTKSKRARGAMIARCKQWLAGTWRGHIGAGASDPGWVRRTPDGFELIPERAETVRTMVDLYRQGLGALRIVKELDRLGLTFAGGRNNADRPAQIIAMRALVGERDFDIDGERFVLPGYYPALMGEDEWQELQRLAKQRGRRRGKGEVPALFTGLGIARCGYCGNLLVSQNGMNRRRQENGLPHDGHRRLVCTAAKNGILCPVAGSCSIVPVERALMAFCADSMNLSRLLAGDSGEQARIAALTRARGAAAATEAKIGKLMDALLEDDGAPPVTIKAKLRLLEDQHQEEQREVERHERELAAVAGSQTPATATAWADLAEGVHRLDFDARTKVRQLVADSFSRILVYRIGYPSYGDLGGRIALELHGKRGSHHVVEIDLDTGALITREDIHESILAYEYPRYLGRGRPTDPAFYDGLVSAHGKLQANEDWINTLPEKVGKIQKPR